MHIRRLSGCLVLALAALAVPPVVSPTPTAAHAGFTSIADDAAADRTATINGTTMKVRVLRPSTSASKPAGGWPLVVYMAGDLKNRCANVNETINSTGVVTRPSWYTRKQLAADGFAVLSFNARGYPAPYNAGVNPSTSTTSGCDALEDAKDAIEKSPGVPENTGWDIAGPLDKQDVHDLIEWAVASYTDPNCASPCIDGSKVGILGAGADSRRALHMAVPLSANPQFNQRVMGVVAVGYEELAVRNLKDLSSDGAVTPTFRKVDQGLWPYAADMHVGHMGRTDASVATNVNELLRAEYLNDTVADSTKTWFDDRAIVDDDVLDTPADQDPRVDKAGLITMPV
ncbi:MAG TPA: hypothetical protein VHF47_08915, partial [Acidimicrobiales bacterium]|nr:hypothetical protein [Acidimicrobiales bacterium]